MSLSALNNPSLIATLGSSVLVAVPLLDEVVQRGSLSWNALRVLNLASYALNNYATSRPGRFDSPKDEKSGSKKSDDSLADEFGVEKEKSLVTPSRW